MRQVAQRDVLPELDGVRAIAVLLVLWEHLPQGSLPSWLDALRPILRPGWLGVDLFFVLSGFLITRILLWERERTQRPWAFLARRAARIFPIYFLTLGVVAVLRPGPELPWAATYTLNYWFLWKDAATPLAHVWSLCVEEHVYLVWPFALFALGAARARVWLLALFPVVLGLGLYACLANELAAAGRTLQCATHLRLLSLGSGALLALHESSVRTARWGRSSWGALAAALLLVQLLANQVAFGLYTAFDPSAQRWWPLTPWIGMCAFSAVALAFAISSSGTRKPWALILASAPLRGIGRISYALYLYHYPVFWAFGILREGPGPSLPSEKVLGAVLTTFALASASYFAIERPILRWAGRFRPREAAC